MGDHELVDVDPMFVGTGVDEEAYRLLPTSPAIDTGSSDFYIDSVGSPESIDEVFRPEGAGND